MGRVWIGIAVAAVIALLAVYFAGGGSGERIAGTRHGTPAATEPGAETAPPAEAAEVTEAERLAEIVVRDVDGNPIAGATVSRFVDGRFVGDGVLTGSDGRCRVQAPEKGGWFPVAARHPDFVLEMGWVSPGEEEHEIVLQRGSAFVVVVLDPAKRPVAGAEVVASFERTHGAAGLWRWSTGQDLGNFTTDAEGRAVVGAAPRGTVIVSVDHLPFAPHESRVDVTGEAETEHVVVLDSGGVLEGRVVDPEGEGIPGATVQLRGMTRPKTTTGPGGEYRLEAVPEGDVRLIASAEGFGPGFFGATLGWGEPVPIPLRSGQTLGGIEIVLSAPSFVVGRVLDEKGEPLEGVDVWVVAAHGYSMSNQTKTDAEGRFRAGPFSVREPGQAHAWFSGSGYRIPTQEGAIEPGRDLDLGDVRATPRATVKGILVDETGHPVQGSIQIHGAYSIIGHESEPDGTFTLEGVAPGTVTLVAERSDPPPLRSVPLAIEAVAGETVEGLEIVLRQTKSIRGRVITPDGRPRQDILVGAKPKEAQPGAGGIDPVGTDEEGRFAFANLADGEYLVGLLGVDAGWWGRPTEFLADPAPVPAEAGRDDLEFIYPIKGGIVVARVVAKADGRPLDEFDGMFLRYKFLIPTDTEYASFRGGVLRWEADEPGTWQVDVSADGFASHRTDRFTLAAGETKDLGTIRLGPGGTIAGIVRDAQGRPVPYTRINILNEKLQTNDDEPFTDLEGRFAVPSVSPGLYTVFAVSPRHPLGMVKGVTVREGERTEVEVAFVRPAPLTIDVRDTSGQPLEDASLSFAFPAIAPLTSKIFRSKIPPGYGSHESDATGTIFQPCLPPGEVTITVEKSGYEPVTRKLDLKPGEANRVEVRLRSAVR